jgi:hypothetical protein
MGILLDTAWATLLDAAPIALVILVFQGAVLRRWPTHLREVLVGAAYLLLGLTLFRLGLEWSLLPIGSHLSDRLAALGGAGEGAAAWYRFGWLYAFVAMLGFATTLVEPALIAIAERVREMTGGAVRPWPLRLVVAGGVALGLLLGTLRIVTGFPLAWSLAGLVGVIAALVALAPRQAVPLAFDCGGFATSVVTVPMVAVFTVGVAAAIPGRDPLTDGFGVILFALLSPVASVLAYAALLSRTPRSRGTGGPHAV